MTNITLSRFPNWLANCVRYLFNRVHTQAYTRCNTARGSHTLACRPCTVSLWFASRTQAYTRYSTARGSHTLVCRPCTVSLGSRLVHRLTHGVTLSRVYTLACRLCTVSLCPCLVHRLTHGIALLPGLVHWFADCVRYLFVRVSYTGLHTV